MGSVLDQEDGELSSPPDAVPAGGSTHQPRLRRAVLVALAVVLPFVALLAYGFTRNPRALPSPLVGRPAPTFQFALFSGGTLDTSALRGKILIVNFWASWCYPACYEEAPRLQRVWERFRAEGVVVIGVNIQDQERPAREFIRQFNQTFPNGMDRSGRISIDFGVYGVPETFIIDQDGLIVDKYVGAVPEEWMVEHIRRLLGGSQDAKLGVGSFRVDTSGPNAGGDGADAQSDGYAGDDATARPQR